MNIDTQEGELLQQVMNAFQAETGLALNVAQEAVELEGQQIDFIVELPSHVGMLAVETKRWAQQANVGALADQIHRLPMGALLAADYINPSMAQKLKALNVQFIDAHGNAYINHPPLVYLCHR